MVILRVVIYTYVQIGKNLLLPVDVLWKSTIFMMTSQGEQLAELTYFKDEFLLYSSSIPAQRAETVIEEDVRETVCTVQAFARNTAETWVTSFSRWLSTRRLFPVVVATRRSSRTLLDLRPLEVCASREVFLTQAVTFSGILDVTLSQTQVEENSLLHVIGVHHL